MSLISQVLKHYGAEQVPGGPGNRKMRCPFHQPDNNPSASVNHAKGVFHCFTCGAGGDAIKIIRTQERCYFKKAVQLAESWFGDSGSAVREAPGRSTGLFEGTENNPPGGRTSPPGGRRR